MERLAHSATMDDILSVNNSLMGYTLSSVTRFVETLLLWQKSIVFGAFTEGLCNIWLIFEPTLVI